MFKKFYWNNYSDSELLQVKIKDLGLQNSPMPSSIQRWIDEYYSELGRKGVEFRPHLWFSDEWFCPDGVPGIAIPFYMLHPRLRELERAMLGYVEGEGKKEFLKIMRHETGHALDNAFGLRRKKKRQDLFGYSSEAYPDHYNRANPSEMYVDYLGDCYASAHPDEDWAETFATWLDRRSNWKRHYASGPARAKLDYIDSVVSKLDWSTAKKSSKTVYPIESINKSLGEHYQEKRKRFRVSSKERLFDGISRVLVKGSRKVSSHLYLRRNKKSIQNLLRKQIDSPVDYIGAFWKEFSSYCERKNLYFSTEEENLQNLSSINFQKEIVANYKKVIM